MQLQKKIGINIGINDIRKGMKKVFTLIVIFTPGAMPMPITTTFPGQTTAVKKVEAVKAEATANEPAYNLMGQPVGEGAKGIVIIGGKKYLR